MISADEANKISKHYLIGLVEQGIQDQAAYGKTSASFPKQFFSEELTQSLTDAGYTVSEPDALNQIKVSW